MPVVRKLDEVEIKNIDAVEKAESEVKREMKRNPGVLNTIRQYAANDRPDLMKHFGIFAEYILVVPNTLTEVVFEVLRGNNPKHDRYIYKVIPRTNDVLIAVQYALPH